jgi:hypothetical protein
VTDGEFGFVALGLGLVILAQQGVVLALTTELRHRSRKAIMEPFPFDADEYEVRRQALSLALQHTMHDDESGSENFSTADDVVARAKTYHAFLTGGK